MLTRLAASQFDGMMEKYYIMTHPCARAAAARSSRAAIWEFFLFFNLNYYYFKAAEPSHIRLCRELMNLRRF